MADLTKYIEVPADKLVKADWNYKEDDEKLKQKLMANLKRNGQVENILVRKLDTGFWEVVNGNHRLDAMIELGMDSVICYDLGDITLHQAIRIAIETNETRFATDQLALSQRIAEIAESYSLEDLEETMPYDKVGLESFARMADFDWDKLTDGEGVDGTGGEDIMGTPIKLTKEQRMIFDQAVERIRKEEAPDISEGRCLELICADFLAAPNHDPQEFNIDPND